MFLALDRSAKPTGTLRIIIYTIVFNRLADCLSSIAKLINLDPIRYVHRQTQSFYYLSVFALCLANCFYRYAYIKKQHLTYFQS